MVSPKKSNKTQLANCLRSFERNVQFQPAPRFSILGSSARVNGGVVKLRVLVVEEQIVWIM